MLARLSLRLSSFPLRVSSFPFLSSFRFPPSSFVASLPSLDFFEAAPPRLSPPLSCRTLLLRGERSLERSLLLLTALLSPLLPRSDSLPFLPLEPLRLLLGLREGLRLFPLPLPSSRRLGPRSLSRSPVAPLSFLSWFRLGLGLRFLRALLRSRLRLGLLLLLLLLRSTLLSRLPPLPPPLDPLRLRFSCTRAEGTAREGTRRKK